MPARKNASAPSKSFPKRTSAADAGKSAAELIDARIRELADWRGDLLARLRRVIAGADASVTEEWKWNNPVWSCDGIICTGETYRKAVKLTFPKGASIPDPARLFNSSLEGNARRAIDFPEGAQVDEAALKALVRAAVAHNESTRGGKRTRSA